MNTGQAQAYYRAALCALRFVEQRRPTGRRFGSDADARWKGFCGHLKTSDRLDLLIRDADAEWLGAFGARTVFSMDAVREDDPFGPGWEPLDPVDAEELWRSELAGGAPSSVGEALTVAAAAWELSIAPIPIGVLGAADRLVVAGPSAIVSLAAAFAEGTDFDWAEQVVVVATPPAHRQLAALAAALVNATRIGRLIDARAQPTPLADARLVTSADADQADANLARCLAGQAAETN